MQDNRFKGTSWEDAEVIAVIEGPEDQRPPKQEYDPLLILAITTRLIRKVTEYDPTIPLEHRNPFADREKIRSWGQKLDDMGGFNLMLHVFRNVQAALVTRFGDVAYGDMRLLEYAWDGVGMWAA